MVISGTEGGSSIWTIEYWSNLSNLVGVFILGAAVPVVTRILKRWEKMRENRKKAEDTYVMNMIKGVTDPMEERMKEVERTNHTILENVNKLTSNFDDFIQEQRDVNARVNYIDKVFQNNMRFGNDRRRPSSSSSYNNNMKNDDDYPER